MRSTYKINGERLTAEELAARIRENGGVKLSVDEFESESYEVLLSNLLTHPERYSKLNDGYKNDSKVIEATIAGYERKCARVTDENLKSNYRNYIAFLSEKLQANQNHKDIQM